MAQQSVQYRVVNPYTGATGESYPLATDGELESAIAAAYATWGVLQRESVADRAARIARVADLHEERKDELAAIITREMGKPLDQAVGEAEFAGAIYRFYADNAERLLADEPIDTDGGTGVIRKASIGPLVGVMPWNFPYYQVARFAGPNLVLGNPILLKHAPQCPESALAIEQIFRDAGMPEGAYTNVFLSNEQVTTAVADPRVRGISLTGSERAGVAVAQAAGSNLKKVVLELGGSDPFIVLSADDLDAVVESAVAARLDNSGQSCNAAKRFIVVDALYDEFAAKMTERLAAVKPGDPTAEGTELGPLSSLAAAERLEAQVQEAIDAGATALLHGARDGALIAPSVLADITPDNPAATQEFFGPVAQLYRVANEDEAIEVANGTPFGLGSYVFSTDAEQAQRVADRIDAGMVFINEVLADAAELPFGGVKRSGTGREMGAIGIEEFMNRKLVHHP